MYLSAVTFLNSRRFIPYFFHYKLYCVVFHLVYGGISLVSPRWAPGEKLSVLGVLAPFDPQPSPLPFDSTRILFE